MSRFTSSANRKIRASSGQTMVEYGVVLAVLTSAVALNQVAGYLP